MKYMIAFKWVPGKSNNFENTVQVKSFNKIDNISNL